MFVQKVAGPMHFTASAEPIAIDEEALAANEDPKVFQEVWANGSGS